MNDRRASPRLRMLVEVYGRTVPLGVPIALLDISRSGMGIRTELPLPVDAQHCFELTLVDGSIVLLDGEVAWRRAEPDGTLTVGVHFTEPVRVAAVFDRITAGVSAPDSAGARAPVLQS